MPNCQFCHQSTNQTYRDSRISDQNVNLINCCRSCSEDKDYLLISSIFRPHLAPIIAPIIPIEPIHEQYLNRSAEKS